MLAALAAIALLAAPTWDASVRAEGRGGTSPASATAESGAAGQFDATLGLADPAGEVGWSLGWSPHYLQNTASEGSPNTLLNTGRAGLVWRADGLTRISLNENFSYGHDDFSPLVAGTPAAILNPRLPVVLALVYIATSTTAALEHRISRQMTYAASVSYIISGGADAPAREFLPLQRTISFTTALAWAVTREDNLNLALNGTGSRFSNHAQSGAAGLTFGWRHSLGAQTTFDAALGTGIGVADGGPSPVSATPFPTGSAGVAHTEPTPAGALNAGLHMTLSPTIDPITGGAYELAQGSLDFSLAPSQNLRLAAHGGLARALTGSLQEGGELLQSEASINYQLSAHYRSTISAGGRLAYTVSAVQAAASGQIGPATTRTDWALFAAFSAGIQGPL